MNELFTSKIISIGRHLKQRLTSQSYWSKHNVTLHEKPVTAEESLRFFHWRNAQYFGYIDLMPVSGVDDKIVVDYGCGPGHDLVGFGTFSKPKKLIGIDVSPTSIAEARLRLKLHNISCQFVKIGENEPLPIENESIDYIHSSGVIHHTPDPIKVLRELRRILKKDGSARIMVYNYNSIWIHLYVAYMLMIVKGKGRNKNVRDVFRSTSDGKTCPISNIYKPDEFCMLAKESGFECKFIGAGISLNEASWLSKRFDALKDRRLPDESRDFLQKLQFDKYGYPTYNEAYAGIDGCYFLTPC